MTDIAPAARMTILLAAALLLAVPGCRRENANKVSFVTTPVVEHVDVNVDQATDQGVRLLVRVQLSNPNDVALPLQRSVFSVAVDGVGEVRLEDQANRTLPRLGTQAVTFPASLPWTGGDPRGRGYRTSGTIQYEPPGEVRTFLTETGVPLPTVRFSGTGSL